MEDNWNLKKELCILFEKKQTRKQYEIEAELKILKHKILADINSKEYSILDKNQIKEILDKRFGF